MMVIYNINLDEVLFVPESTWTTSPLQYQLVADVSPVSVHTLIKFIQRVFTFNHIVKVGLFVFSTDSVVGQAFCKHRECFTAMFASCHGLYLVNCYCKLVFDNVWTSGIWQRRWCMSLGTLRTGQTLWPLWKQHLALARQSKLKADLVPDYGNQT